MNRTQRNKGILLLISFFFIVNACNKEVDEIIESPQEEIKIADISGNVELPAASGIDVNTLSIVSFADEVNVSNGDYTVETAVSNHNVLLALDGSDEIVMMGYVYPGQTDYSLSPKSTALALLMNLPISQQISHNGKTDFVKKILADPNFQPIVRSLDSLIGIGVSPLDTNQVAFMLQLLNYFDQVSKITSNIAEAPVKIQRANKSLIFTNDGNSYSTAIGVYKDGAKIDSFILDRVTFIPGSTGKVIDGIVNNNTPGLVDRQYQLTSDGNYEFVIRTGWHDDGTDEFREALWNNLANFSYDFVNAFIPLSRGCAGGVIKSLYSLAKASHANFGGSNITLFSVYDLLLSWVKLGVYSANCTDNTLVFKKYMLQVKKYLWWLKAVKLLGNGGNTMVGIVQMAIDDNGIDTCYSVKGNRIGTCSDPLRWKTQPTSNYPNCDPSIYECDIIWSTTGGVHPLTLIINGGTPQVGIPNSGFINGYGSGINNIIIYDSAQDTIIGSVTLP